MFELVLASQSPRRRDILLEAGYKFQTCPVNVSETLNKNLTLDEAIKALAREKAEAFVQSIKNLKSQSYLVLSADTLVCLDGETLGKPQDAHQAKVYLRRLSSRTHLVKTGICIWPMASQGVPAATPITALDTTEVLFRELSDLEIEAYVASGEPFDKAGGYGIQGAGGNFIQSYQGSFKNVMGLPIELFEKILKEQGWKVRE